MFQKKQEGRPKKGHQSAGSSTSRTSRRTKQKRATSQTSPRKAAGGARSAKKAKAKEGRRTLHLLIFAILVCLLALVYSLKHPSLSIAYREEIFHYARQEGLDPALVAAVIRQESNFDPQAQSRVGAQGLMQLMPQTAEEIARKKGEDAAGDLYSIDTNLSYGSFYLAYLLDRFDGQTATALAAYNAGPTITAQWLEDPDYSADGKTLTSIPYRETSHYVKKVLAYYQEYKKADLFAK